MSLFKKKKSLKIGQRVAVIAFSRSSGRDEFRVGKIVAIRPQEEYNSFDYNYAVRFDDGKIDLFTATQLFTEWGEEAE